VSAASWVSIAIMGVLFTVIYGRYGLEAEFVVLGIAVALLMVVALIDLERGLILNSILYPSIVVLIVMSPFWTEIGLSRSFLGSDGLVGTLLNSLLSGLGAFLIFLVIAMAYPNGVGGGDVKLGGVIGLLVGFPGALIALLLAVVAGGLVAIALVLTRKLGRKDAMPFGPFMSLGAIVALLAGSEITAWYNDLGDFAAGPQ
jgi:leader peptidase (prepilin peptidase)/N-methyltransferase